MQIRYPGFAAMFIIFGVCLWPFGWVAILLGVIFIILVVGLCVLAHIPGLSFCFARCPCLTVLFIFIPLCIGGCWGINKAILYPIERYHQREYDRMNSSAQAWRDYANEKKPQPKTKPAVHSVGDKT